MTDAVLAWSRRVVIALMLPLACLFGNVAPYIVAVVCIALGIVLLINGRLSGIYRQPLALLFLIAFAVLAACFMITAEAPGDPIYAFNFIMLVLAGPLLLAMAGGAGPENARRIAWLAFAGALVGLVIVAAALLGGENRGYWRALGPNRLANTAMLLGFLALIGLAVDGGRERWLLLVGPVIGLAVTFLTQSRGPLLAAALMLPLALALGVRLLPRRLLWPAAAAAIVLAVAGGVVLMSQDRIARLPEIVGDILAGETVSDYTTHIRLALYRGAVEAFMDAPLLGHGWDELMSAALPYLEGADRAYAADLPQLHNDFLDFAVAAGVVGIAVYLLLLAAPLIAAWRSPPDGQRLVRLYGTSVLVAGYAGAGLTDLMFGFEFHTALYVVLATILVGYCRDRAEHGS